MTAAALVRSVQLLTFPVVRAAAWSMWTAPRLRERYPVYLAAMHGLTRASVPLMEAAIGSCGRLAGDELTAARLAEYFRSHIAEERDHDAWLLEDLAVLGVRQPDELPGPIASEDIAALAGAQYYWIRHMHPACLLGYICVLEGCPPDAGMVARLPARTGLPSAAFRTLAWHAALDPGHFGELDRLLDALPLRPEVTALVARNAAYTAARAAALLNRLAGESGGRERPPP